jgi:LysM repeat protein
VPPVAARAFGAPDLRLAAPGPQMVGGVVLQPKERMAPVASGLPNALPPLDGAPNLRPVVAPAAAPQPTTIAARPGETLREVSRRTGAPVREVARLNGAKPNARLAAGESVIVPNTFEVAFDGARIAFDVAPRVVAGIQLAPFRQIFEHTGGRLYWFGGSAQMVRAVNNTREIEIKIGSSTALVNNQPLTLEKKAYIEGGRTIVPLTFVRDALNVKVHFDPESGRLLIESVK